MEYFQREIRKSKSVLSEESQTAGSVRETGVWADRVAILPLRDHILLLSLIL